MCLTIAPRRAAFCIHAPVPAVLVSGTAAPPFISPYFSLFQSNSHPINRTCFYVLTRFSHFIFYLPLFLLPREFFILAETPDSAAALLDFFPLFYTVTLNVELSGGTRPRGDERTDLPLHSTSPSRFHHEPKSHLLRTGDRRPHCSRTKHCHIGGQGPSTRRMAQSSSRWTAGNNAHGGQRCYQ